jgi:ParB-like chromosome segregation protein Spo0J
MNDLSGVVTAQPEVPNKITPVEIMPPVPGDRSTSPGGQPESRLRALRTAMRGAIEQRSVPEIEDIFAQAWRLLTSAQVSELRHKREKNIKRQYAAWKIELSVERLRAQWLVDTGKATLRFIRPKDTKIGAPIIDLIKLDAPGRPPRIGIDRKKSQQLQAFARLTEAQFKTVLADKTMPTLARIIKLYATPATAGHRSSPVGPKIHNISLSSIESPRYRVRTLRQNVVDALADSMRDRSLIHPITLRPREGFGYSLIAGLHRLVAARKLGWEKIHAIVLRGTDAVEAELIEIDENLIRADLTPAEQAAHHTRRKELYEQKHGKAKAKGAHEANRKMGRRHDATDNLSDAYTTDAAKKTGKNPRSVRRDVARGENIPNVAALAGTSLDQGAELDALAKLKDIAPDRQAELIEKAKSGENVSAKAEIEEARRPKQETELAQQPDKPAPEPLRPNISNLELPAPESAAKEPMCSNNDAPAQHDLAPAKPDDASPTAPGEPAPQPDPWADRRALFRESIRGLRELQDDFAPLIATMPSGEADEAKDVVFALSAAFHAAIHRATPVEEPMSPAA